MWTHVLIFCVCISIHVNKYHIREKHSTGLRMTTSGNSKIVFIPSFTIDLVDITS